MTTIKERLKELAQHYQLSIRGFEERCGLGRGNINNMNEEGNLGSDKLSKIIDTFPEVSLKWLIMGDGTMLYQNVIQPQRHSIDEKSSQNEGLPYYDVDFVGGFDEMINDQTIAPDCYLSVPGFERADFWCNVRGNSMYPLIKNGDLIALKEIPSTSIHYGEVYAVVLNETRTIKKIRSSDNKAKLRFIPINTEEFDEQEYHKQDIIRVFEVMGTISKFF